MVIKSSKLIAVILMCCLCACSATRGKRYTLEGVLLGGSAGAIVGAASGSSIPIAAAVGGAIGGIIGNFVPRTFAYIQDLESEGLNVTQLGDTMTIMIPSDELFPIYSYRLDVKQSPLLNELAALIKEFPNAWIKIAAYTDNLGGYAQSMELTLQQAQSVASYLWTHGISAQRMETVGYGLQYPIAPNRTIDGTATNRRIEITIDQA